MDEAKGLKRLSLAFLHVTLTIAFSVMECKLPVSDAF